MGTPWRALVLLAFLLMGSLVFAQVEIPAGYEVIRITSDADYDGPPAINNCGQIVFSKRIGQSFDGEEIFLYENGTLTQITHDNVRDAFPDINDAGVIVWSRAIGTGNVTFDIAVYDNSLVAVLTQPESNDYSPKINVMGHILWAGITEGPCDPATLFLYDGTGIRAVTSDAYSNQGASLNDYGEMAWTRYNFCRNPWVSTIVYQSAEEQLKLTDGQSQVQSVAINNLSELVWRDKNGGISMWNRRGVSILTVSGGNPDLSNRGHVVFNRWKEEERTYELWLWSSGREWQLTEGYPWNTSGVVNDFGEVA